MSMFEIIRARGTGATEAVEPGNSIVIDTGDRIVCDQSFTEVTSIARIDNNLQLKIADNPAIVFNQFFSAQNPLIQFSDKQLSLDELNKLLSVHLRLQDNNSVEHNIALLPGSEILTKPGDNYFLDSKLFNIKDLHRQDFNLIIQSHDQEAKVIAILSGFFTKPEVGIALPQLHIVDPSIGATKEMIVHPHSTIFQWEGEPLPTAVVGSLYGYYFQLQGADADKFILVAKTSEGELPPWMTFSHVDGGKYYLAGIPTAESAGHTEIVINAYSTQNNIGFHTQQSFQLHVKTIDDTVTRHTVGDVATAEFRSLSETITADSFVTGIVAVDQMPYMSMPEIAVVTGLAAINPVTMTQMFSNYTTPEEIHSAKELSEQTMLTASQEILPEEIVNHVVATSHTQEAGAHVVHGVAPVQIVAQPAASTTTSSTQTTPASSPQPPSEPLTSTSQTTSTNTDMVIMSTPTNNNGSNNNLLTIITTPPPPPPTFITLESYLDGTHGIILDGDIFFGSYPGRLGTSAFIIPNATGNGFGVLVDSSITGRTAGNTLGDVYYLNGQSAFPREFHITDPGVSGTVFSPPFNQVLYPTQIYNASDFNGDGYADMFFVAYTNQGFTSYIVFGSGAGFPSNVNLGNLVSSGGAMALTSANPFTNGGALGDINGDGLSDVGLVKTISFPGFTQAYVFLGTHTPPTSLDVSSLDGTNGFTITASGRFGIGQSNTIMGIDINGDGFNDILFKTYNGVIDTATVIFGSGSGFPSSFDVGNVGQPGQPAGFVIFNSTDSLSSSHHFADPAVNIGNFNGSNIDSLVINELNLFTLNSSTYVVFGSHSFTNNVNLDLSTLNGSNGFELTSSAPQHYVTSIAYLGDVNGDGIADFGFIDKSAYGGKGAAYIIFGSTNPFPAVIDYSHLSPNQGFVIQFTPGVSATTIGGGGDLNGDGLADIILSNPTTNVGPAPAYGASGVSYIVFGSNFNGVITLKGTAGSETLTGTNGNDVIYGGGGNDIINALGGNDFIDAPGNTRIYAGAGNDTIVYYHDDAPVSGGTGTDTLWFKYDNTHVSFIGATNYTGIDAINLAAMQNMVGNSVTLDASTIAYMSDANLMTINGNAHDILTLTATDFWTPSSVLAGYTTYTSMSGSVVNVQNAVHVTFAPPSTPVTLSYTISSLMDGVHGFELTNTPLLHATSSTIIQNGDGFGDLFIANGFSAGASPYTRAFIVDGQASFGAVLPFNDPSLTTSLFNNTSFGSPISAYGQHVNSIGDFNGDGVNDILISEFFGGYSHIILGQPSGFPSTSSIASVGINLPGHYNATTSAALGDVNGDGLSDIALSDSQSPWAAVIFGTTTPGSFINTTTLNGTNGFEIVRPGSNLAAGIQDVGAVDLTGDGKNDVFISYYDTTSHVGSIGVILGNSPAFSPFVSVSSAGIVGANGFLITNSGATPGPADYLAYPTDIGTFNGSGVDSIAIASQNSVYVIFGNTAFNTSSNFDVGSLNGTNGFELTASGVHNITSVAYLGDVNGDGLPDFAFFDGAANGGQGAVYVIFGSSAGFAPVIDYTNLNSTQGFEITNPAGFTYNQTVAGLLGAATVSGGGDLNGDGLGDIVITSGSNEYVIYGRNFNGAITQLGDPNHTVIQGTGSHDVIFAGSGDHTIVGGSGFTFIDSGTGHDIINGGPGINTIVYSALDTSVDAGIGGPNTLWLENDGIIANLQNTTIFKDFDVIDLRPLRSLQGNEVDLNPQGVSNMSHNNTLQVEGGAHDSLVLHNSGLDVWSAGPVVNLGGFLYTTYTSAVTHSTVYAENTLNHVTVV